MIRQFDDSVAKGRTIIVRVDHNVPIGGDGKISDYSRILRTLPLIRRLLTIGRRVVVLTHWGYPGGQHKSRLSTRPLAELVASSLQVPVRFCETAEPQGVERELAALTPGSLLYCENVRFLAGEERNDQSLAEGWASLADIFVNEAFSVSHRTHASISAIATRCRSFAGPLFTRERHSLRSVSNGSRPRALILGGAKVRDKLACAVQLLDRFDLVALGGLCGAHVSAGLARPEEPADESQHDEWSLLRQNSERVGPP